ncbi:MAG: hypothetical protein ACK5BE_05505 [Alphaproteobacteria bacterium]|jgi:hypothetical protein
MIFNQNQQKQPAEKPASNYKGGITFAQIIVFVIILYYLFHRYFGEGKTNSATIKQSLVTPVVEKQIENKPSEIVVEAPTPPILDSKAELRDKIINSAYCGDYIGLKPSSQSLYLPENIFSILLGQKDIYTDSLQKKFFGLKVGDKKELTIEEVFEESGYLNEDSLYDFLQSKLIKNSFPNKIKFSVEKIEHIYKNEDEELNLSVEELENIDFSIEKFCGDTTVIGFKIVSPNVIASSQEVLKEQDGFKFIKFKLGLYGVPVVFERIAPYIKDNSHASISLPFSQLRNLGQEKILSFSQKQNQPEEIIKLEIIGEKYKNLNN